MIEEYGIEYEYFDLTKQSIDFESLLKIYNTNRIPLKKYFNTSGVEYRTKGIKDLFDLRSEEEMLKLLSENGLLLKRPFIIDDEVLIGNNYERLIEKYGN